MFNIQEKSDRWSVAMHAELTTVSGTVCILTSAVGLAAFSMSSGSNIVR